MKSIQKFHDKILDIYHYIHTHTHTYVYIIYDYILDSITVCLRHNDTCTQGLALFLHKFNILQLARNPSTNKIHRTLGGYWKKNKGENI